MKLSNPSSTKEAILLKIFPHIEKLWLSTWFTARIQLKKNPSVNEIINEYNEHILKKQKKFFFKGKWVGCYQNRRGRSDFWKWKCQSKNWSKVCRSYKLAAHKKEKVKKFQWIQCKKTRNEMEGRVTMINGEETRI